MDQEFEDTVVLVTAAAGGGIGQAIATRFAAGGAVVVVTDLHAGRTDRVTAELAAAYPTTTVLGYQMDVADRGRIDAVLADVQDRVGPVRILVNNAARNVIGSIFDYDPQDWDECLAVNLSGPWYLCRQVMPGMRDAGGGAIVNISSLAADNGGEGTEGPYAVGKGGLNVLTRSCAHEGGPHNIRVNSITMGVVTGTRFIDANPEIAERMLPLTPLRRHGTAQDIAELAAFLASERARFITGETVNVSGGFMMRH